jgi:hypothetical protein
MTKFGVIEKGSYWESGYDDRDPGSTVYYDKLVEFESKEKLLEHLKRDAARSSPLVKKVFKLEELTYSTEIVINGI